MRKRTIEVDEDEYEEIKAKQQKKDRKRVIERIKRRNESMKREIKDNMSIRDLLHGAIVDSDRNKIVLPDEDYLWSVDYIDLVSDEVLDCDKKYKETINDKYEFEYTEKLFEGVPCTPKVVALAYSIKEDIVALSFERERVVDRINIELKEMIWSCANEHMKTRRVRTNKPENSSSIPTIEKEVAK